MRNRTAIRKAIEFAALVASSILFAWLGEIVLGMAVLGIGGGFLVLVWEHGAELERRALERAARDWNSQLFGYREEIKKKVEQINEQIAAIRRERMKIVFASFGAITEELSKAFEKCGVEAAKFEAELNRLATIELHRRKAEILGRRSPFKMPASTLRPKDKPRPFVSMPRPRDNA